jgi:hypothetical protein
MQYAAGKYFFAYCLLPTDLGKGVNMKLNKSVLFLMILIPFSLYSQNYIFSIQIKTSALYVEQYTNSEYAKRLAIYPLSLYLGNKFKISEDYQFEISPGVFIGGENFWGPEIGVFLRYYFYKDIIFGIAGPNFHYSFGVGHGTSIAESVPGGFYTNLGLSVGINSSNKNVAFILSFYKPLSEDYGYTHVYNFEEGSGKLYKRNLFAIIQAGLEFNL